MVKRLRSTELLISSLLPIAINLSRSALVRFYTGFETFLKSWSSLRFRGYTVSMSDGTPRLQKNIKHSWWEILVGEGIPYHIGRDSRGFFVVVDPFGKVSPIQLLPYPTLPYGLVGYSVSSAIKVYLLPIRYWWNALLQRSGTRSGDIPLHGVSNRFTLYRQVANLWFSFRFVYRLSLGFFFYYAQGFVFLLFIDACLTDDEPLWEPIEWSLMQTWILFIFLFGWIAENLIVSRYGSYTGRDKRVWMSWYKTFWLIEAYYMLNFGFIACFIITPLYFEINYSLPLIYTWWNWYSRTFFFKFTSLFTIVLLLGHLLQLGVRWLNWRKLLVLVVIINFFLSYLLYTHFIMSFFGYWTDPIWYQKNRPIDYIQLSHEPLKWGWGVAKHDHHTYHNSHTVFWFKNDSPFASAFLLFHLYIFLSIFLVYIYWIALFRRIYSMREVPMTFTIYCVSSLRQLFYYFLLLYTFIFVSFITQYWRLPIEFLWGLNNQSWSHNLFTIAMDYPQFLHSLVL